MSQQKNSSNHHAFLSTVQRIEQSLANNEEIVLSAEEINIIIAERDWLTKFLENKSLAARSNRQAGRKKLPDSEVSAKTLKMREWRKKRNAKTP